MCLKFAATVAVESNYVAFGEKAVLMVVDLYGMTAAEPCVVKGEILKQIIEVRKNKIKLLMYQFNFTYTILLKTRFQFNSKMPWKKCIILSNAYKCVEVAPIHNDLLLKMF